MGSSAAAGEKKEHTVIGSLPFTAVENGLQRNNYRFSYIFKGKKGAKGRLLRIFLNK